MRIKTPRTGNIRFARITAWASLQLDCQRAYVNRNDDQPVAGAIAGEYTAHWEHPSCSGQRLGVPLALPYYWSIPPTKLHRMLGNYHRQSAAAAAWEQFKAQGMLNVYILAGGVNFWLDVYGGPATPGGFIPANDDLTSALHGEIDTARIMTPFDPAAVGDDRPRHRFKGAHGEAYPAARPGRADLPQRDYEKKVVIQQAGPKVSGGCG